MTFQIEGRFKIFGADGTVGWRVMQHFCVAEVVLREIVVVGIFIFVMEIVAGVVGKSIIIVGSIMNAFIIFKIIVVVIFVVVVVVDRWVDKPEYM